MNLHLTHRALAIRLADAGFHVVRFDPTGTADASGGPREPGWPGGWWADARACGEHLLARSGAARIAAFGSRFGATLAATLPEVDTLMLWGPHRDGSTFLRAEKALTRLVGANPSGIEPEFARPDDAEYLGFVYSAGARDVLSNVRPLAQDGTSCRHVRLVAWDDGATEADFAEWFSKLGAHVELARPDGFCSDDSLEHQAVPEPLLAGFTRWLVSIDELESQAPLRTPSSTNRLASKARVDRGPPNSGAVYEEVLRFGAGGDLIGILTTPVESLSEPGVPTVAFVSGGNNHRPGINRNYTEWAREAALRGCPALRFDIRGLGDSPPERAETLNVLYREETRQDVREAVSVACDRTGSSSVALVGLCAGAYQAFHAARSDARVGALVLLDLLRWDPDAPTSTRVGFWARRERALARWWERLGPSRGSTTVLGEGLLEITRRGSDVLIVSCLDEVGGSQVVEAIDSVRPALDATGRLRVELVTDTNHIFSPLWSQAWLSKLLADYLDTAGDSVS